MTDQLTVELLEQLRARWDRLGAQVASSLRPGLDEAAMDRLTRRLGIRLPAEARRWWGWHDGATSRPGLEPEVLGYAGAMSFFPLARAVKQTADIRASLEGSTYAPNEESPAEGDWRSEWLLLTDREHPIVLDCSVDEQAPVPVLRYDYVEGTRYPALKSMGELVTGWIEAIDTGFWTFDPQSGLWESTHDRSGLRLARYGLV